MYMSIANILWLATALMPIYTTITTITTTSLVQPVVATSGHSGDVIDLSKARHAPGRCAMYGQCGAKSSSIFAPPLNCPTDRRAVQVSIITIAYNIHY
jgi:hypothetical protein